MRLGLRFLGGALVGIALTFAATYLLIEVHEYIEEEYFSGTVPLFLEIFFLIVVGITLMVIVQFTMAKSYGEIVEIEMQKKERKKREKERKKRESDIEGS